MSFIDQLTTAITSGECLVWRDGDVTLPEPVCIDVPHHAIGSGLDMQGARLICGFGDPEQDMLKIRLPQNGIQFRGFQFRNIRLSGEQACRNGLVLENPYVSSAMYAGTISNVYTEACLGSGLQLAGCVFETMVSNCGALDCGNAGVEVRNVGQGINSDIRIIGGTFSQCGYGISATADVTYREPPIRIAHAYIGRNKGNGISALGGLDLAFDVTLENNCAEAATEGSIHLGEDMAIYARNFSRLSDCKAVGNSSTQLYLLAQGNGAASLTRSWVDMPNAPNCKTVLAKGPIDVTLTPPLTIEDVDTSGHDCTVRIVVAQ
jgi:hypothetical protein